MPTTKEQPSNSKAAAKAKVQKTQNKPAAAKKAAARPVLYEVPRADLHDGNTLPPIDYDLAKQLLGWEVEEQPDDKGKVKNPFGKKFDLEYSGTKVRLTNNVTNRPIYPKIIDCLKQDVLRGHWRFNGEAIIIGRTGQVLNGQHTLIMFVEAVDDWREGAERYPFWQEEPTLVKLVVYGVEEVDEIINTMDTCKPRSLADVLYRAEYFNKLSEGARKNASRVTDYAIRMMWHKTGTHSNAFDVKRTHSESIDFLDRHAKLLAAVQHVSEEDGGGKLSKYLSLGNCAAALYLMASSNTDPAVYYGSDSPQESLLDFSLWDLACKFFVELASSEGPGSMKAVRDAIGKLSEAGNTSQFARLAVFAKAWEAYSEGKPITAKTVALEFEMRDEVLHLVESPLFGGIDVGEDGLDLGTEDPAAKSGEAVAVNKAKKKAKAKRDAADNVKVASRAGKEWAKGDKAWVHPPGDDQYFCELMEDPYETQQGTMDVQVSADDGNWIVQTDLLSLAQFEMKN